MHDSGGESCHHINDVLWRAYHSPVELTLYEPLSLYMSVQPFYFEGTHSLDMLTRTTRPSIVRGE
jgi:hypothetical protein